MILSIKPRVIPAESVLKEQPKENLKEQPKEVIMPNGNEKEAQQKINIKNDTPKQKFNFMPLLLIAGAGVAIYFLFFKKGVKAEVPAAQ